MTPAERLTDAVLGGHASLRLAGLGNAPRESDGAPQALMWAHDLGAAGVSPEAVQAGMAALRRRQWWPSLGEVLAACQDAQDALHPTERGPEAMGAELSLAACREARQAGRPAPVWDPSAPLPWSLGETWGTDAVRRSALAALTPSRDLARGWERLHEAAASGDLRAGEEYDAAHRSAAMMLRAMLERAVDAPPHIVVRRPDGTTAALRTWTTRDELRAEVDGLLAVETPCRLLRGLRRAHAVTDPPSPAPPPGQQAWRWPGLDWQAVERAVRCVDGWDRIPATRAPIDGAELGALRAMWRRAYTEARGAVPRDDTHALALAGDIGRM